MVIAFNPEQEVVMIDPSSFDMPSNGDVHQGGRETGLSPIIRHVKAKNRH
jgi:hypothetical protein